MLRLNHYNDGKEKSQSHEIRIRECRFYCAEYDVFSHNPFDITGYGETKEEALDTLVGIAELHLRSHFEQDSGSVSIHIFLLSNIQLCWSIKT